MLDPARDRQLSRVLLAAVVVLSVALSVFQINNDDAGFHTATGRWIRATGEVPLTNPFSYAEDGHVWTQHQWLPAVAISSVVDAFGAKGLIIAKAAFVGFMVGLIALFIAGQGLPAPWGAAPLIIFVNAGAFRFKERPLLVSVLVLALVVGLLSRWRAGGFRNRRLAVVAALLPVLCIHLHAGGIYAMLVWFALAAAVVAKRLSPLFRGTDEAPPDDKTVVLVVALLFGVVALSAASLALFAPSGIDVLLLPFSFGSHGYWNAHLAEFRPLKLVAWAHMQWYAVALVGVGAIVGLVRRRLFEAFVLLGFGYLGVRHQRLVLPMAMAAAPAFAAILSDARIKTWLAGRTPRLAAATVALLVASIGYADHAAWHRMGLGIDGFDHRRHPIELFEKAAPLPGETFISDGLSGVWLWRNFRGLPPAGATNGVDQRRVLVHNCLECYEESTYIDVYQRIRYGQPGWKDEVSRLGIRSFFIKHTSAGERRFQAGRPNIRQHLFADPDWLLVDFDDVAALWIHRAATSTDASYLADFPVDPDTGFSRRTAPWPEVASALNSHADSHPKTTRSLVILAHRAASVGDRKTLAYAVDEAVKRGASDRVVAELMGVMKRFVAGARRPAAPPK